MTQTAVQRLIHIHADAEGNPPTRIHLMTAGHWHTPYHGAFEMTPTDLADMILNFENGVGLVQGSKKLPINYGHDISGKAAGWITGFSLENDGAELWGDVRWTKEGRRMLSEEEFKYISPEWNPRDLPWENPEVEGEVVDNVITGAGLTNIPLFKKLKPVMASVASGVSDNSKQGDDMTLEEIRVKKLEDLTDEEKAFLSEHKSELTDEERTAFGLTEADEDSEDDAANHTAAGDVAPENAKTDEEDEGNGADGAGNDKIEASVKVQGLSASEITQLQADAKAGREAQQELLRTRLTASVKSHVDRGAIKSDQATEAVDLLMASSESQRDRLTKFMASLPENTVITAGVKGKSVTASTDVELTDAEKEFADGFNLTAEEVAEYKKLKEEGKE